MPPSNVGRFALGWAARLALLLGGASLAVRFGVPASVTPAVTPTVTDDSDLGRGEPGVPASSGARAAGHETEDMSGALMGRLMIGLAVVLTLVIGGLIGLRSLVQRLDNAAAPPLTAEQTASVVPPPPNLQNDPVGDLARLNEAENRLLGNYAWIDPEHTRGRIPIDRAMALMVGHPLDTAP